MTSIEFVIWMKGIVVASNNYNIDPSTWDIIKDKLDIIEDNNPQFTTFKTYVPLNPLYFTTTTCSDKK